MESLKQSAPYMLAQAPGEALKTMTGLMPKPPVQEFTSPSGQKYLQDPRGGIHMIPPPKPVSTRLAQTESMELQDLYRSKRELQKTLSEEQENLAALESRKTEKDYAPAYASTKAQVDMLQKQIKDAESRIKSFSKTSDMEPPGATESKAVRRANLANQILRQNPGMSREEIMAEVRKQIP
jgi:hypothetical protein